MLPTGYTLRIAGAEHAGVVRHHRRAMFHAMGLTDDARLNQMDAAFADWLNARLADGRYIGLLACAEDGEIAAGAGAGYRLH